MPASILPRPLLSRLVAALLAGGLAARPGEAAGLLLELGGDLGLGRAEVRAAASPLPESDPAQGAPGHDALRALGAAYAAAAFPDTVSHRQAGVFYTPREIIDRILDFVEPRAFPGGNPAPMCDPALGCGFFPLRLVERLEERGVALPGRRAWAAALHGVDRDPGAVCMTRVLLCLALSEPGSPHLPDPARFRAGDSLLGPAFGEAPAAGDAGLDWSRAFPEVAAAGGFAAVVGNPPYEVLTNFARHPDRERLARALGRAGRAGRYRLSLDGQINLYRCFVERCLALVRPGGPVSLVVPLSLARDAAAARLRRHLIERSRAEDWRLYRERERLFAGATQSACVFGAVRDAGPAARVRIRGAGGETELTPAELDALDPTGGMALPEASAEEVARMRWLRRHATGSLADLAAMRVGDVDQTVYRACMTDTDSGCLLARGEHLRPFVLDIRPRPGKARFLDLERFLAMKGRTAADCRRRAAARRVAQLGIRNMQSLPRLVAAEVPPGVYLGNSLNVFYPLDGVETDFLVGLLNSGLLDWMFRFASGNNNINLREMAALPYPAANAGPRRPVILAARRCARAAAAGDPAALDQARRALDEAVERHYRLPAALSLL